MRKSIMAGTILFLIGAIFFVLSFFYSFGTIDNIGPGFFPKIISVVLMICGIFSLFGKND